MGLNGDWEEQLNIEKGYITAKFTTSEDKKTITFNGNNKGENIQLTPEQILGAYLNKLKRFFHSGSTRPDIVLSVPAYFSAVERQAVLDACRIGGVNCLKLVNENTAVALQYGFFRRKEFAEKKERIVAFRDLGHGKATATIASFTTKKVKIVSHTSDRNLGARNFDTLLMKKFSAEFEAKYGCNPMEAPRSRLRILDAIEKTRKQLSGNLEALCCCEALMEDEDLDCDVSREKFDEMITPDIERL